ncbi:hypothetical protein RvY_17141 [Ramazzottius varieornatus]|uniref:Repulsive guidance molecule C-terminal domain-containing protein n=1 Tax=Ramazzottius varieornatus TaxID=947166 RepID=A0A1D1W757_RAMVA|nr:hypothetical protein RvY_17141 [Ramazzottius varieornatus]
MKGKRKFWEDLNGSAVLWAISIVICMTAISQVSGRGTIPCHQAPRCMADFQQMQASGIDKQALDDHDALYTFCEVLYQSVQCIQELDCSVSDMSYRQNSPRVLLKLLNQRNCSQFEAEFARPVEMQTRPPTTTTTEPYINLPSHTGCSAIMPSQDILYCSVFGDPHVITDKSHFQTCGIKGAYPLFENQYLAIQVRFDPVKRSSSPHTVTAISRVLVIVKGHEQCSPERKVYEASVGNMPTSFEDNTGDSDTVQLVKRIPGHLHEIRITHLKAIIFIRCIGDYLSVAMRMHKPIMETEKYYASYQLCSLGCPTREILSRRRILGELPLKPLQQAEEWCTSHNLTGPFYEACYFDAALTGDFNVVLVSKEAQQDWERLAPTMDGVRSAAWTARYNMTMPTMPHAQSVRNNGVSEAINVKMYYFVNFTFPAWYLLCIAFFMDWLLVD